MLYYIQMNRNGVRKTTRVVKRKTTGRYSGGAFKLGRWLKKAATSAGRFAVKQKLLSKLMALHPSTAQYAPIVSMVGLGAKKSCGHMIKSKCKCKSSGGGLRLSGQGIRLAGGKISMVTNRHHGMGLRT